MASGLAAGALILAMLPGLAADQRRHRSEVASRNGTAIGTAGIGDAYFPGYGNGGYDVQHYDLDVRYDPDSDRLDGRARIRLRASVGLGRFNLDLGEFEIESIAVNGTSAQWTRTGGTELSITPATGLIPGRQYTVEVAYHGTPGGSGSAGGGFIRTPDGAVVAGEPDGALSWFPSNNHPRDKATFDVAVTVPNGLTAVANGIEAGTTDAGNGWTTWRWRETRPMATYLATMAIGRFRLLRGTSAGLPVLSAVAAALPNVVDDAMARTPEIVTYLASLFGPYPFDAMGGIVVDAPGMSFALETQTRPVYGPTFFTRGDAANRTIVLAHELTHQWFGDSVSLHDWRDIWLNEGFATYGQWLWTEHLGISTVQRSVDQAYAESATSAGWQPPPGDPGVDKLFGGSVYERGGMTLHALRLAVGDDAFFRILRTWTAERRYGTGTTAEFVALAERIAGRSLADLFDVWLNRTPKPPRPAP
jgi:aminopeptidase N